MFGVRQIGDQISSFVTNLNNRAYRGIDSLGEDLNGDGPRFRHRKSVAIDLFDSLELT